VTSALTRFVNPARLISVSPVRPLRRRADRCTRQDTRMAGTPNPDYSYDHRVEEAVAASIAGWDFSWLQGRTTSTDLPWSYPDLARDAIRSATRLLDLDTGGGEQLSDLQPLPEVAAATEAWPPNVAVAQSRLAALGVDVRPQTGARLPAGDAEFDLILSRHGAFDPAEFWRVLSPDGVVLTQQVGVENDLELNRVLGAPVADVPRTPEFGDSVAQLERVGFTILTAREAHPAYAFHDIGAVVYQLRMVPWQIPDFDIDRYDQQLRQLDNKIRRDGPFTTHNDRFLIQAAKPA